MRIGGDPRLHAENPQYDGSQEVRGTRLVNQFCAPLNVRGAFARVVIIKDPTVFDYVRLKNEVQLSTDIRNATEVIESPNIFRS
jgi:hypothetical protein